MRPPKTSRVGRTLVAMVIVAVGIFALVKTLHTEQIVTVYVASPTFQSMNTSVTTNGRVIPTDDFQARAAFSGTVEKVMVHIGEKVTAGQLLVRMYDPYAPSRYASAAATLQGAEVGDENLRRNGSQEDRINMQGDFERAETEKADAQKQLSLLKELLKTGASSEGEIANAQHRVAAATESVDTLQGRMTNRYSKAELTASSARVEDAKASLKTARLVLANANVVSTIPGTVYSLPVTASDFVPMGVELMRITDLSKVQVHAYVDEPEMGHLAVDQPVTVTWEAKPDKIWHGRVKEVPLTVSNKGARIVGDCVIAMEDADGTLLPNTNVAVNIATSKPVRALVIPRGALRTEGKESYVFRLVGGRLVWTKVQTGIVDIHFVQIVSGLSEQDVVAVKSTTVLELTNGMKVQAAP